MPMRKSETGIKDGRGREFCEQLADAVRLLQNVLETWFTTPGWTNPARSWAMPWKERSIVEERMRYASTQHSDRTQIALKTKAKIAR